MEKVGIALIGAGNIAQNVHLPILAKLRNVNLVALCDRNKSKARILCEKYNIPHDCRTVEELMKIDGIDAVDICTSTDAHYDMAITCLESGKDVLIEKPIARSAEEALHMVETAERLDRKLMVAMNHRFRPDTIFLKDRLHREELGKVYYMKSGWLSQRSNQKRWLAQADRAGGGVLLDLGIVLLDLMLWLYDYEEVHSVRATMHHHKTRNVEDFVAAFINFKDDRVATLEASWTLMRPEEFYYCNIFGENGSAYINPLKIIKNVQNELVEQKDLITIRSKPLLYRKSYQAELQHFANAVLNLVPTVSTGREALKRMRIIEAMYRSARERAEVVLDV